MTHIYVKKAKIVAEQNSLLSSSVELVPGCIACVRCLTGPFILTIEIEMSFIFTISIVHFCKKGKQRRFAAGITLNGDRFKN